MSLTWLHVSDFHIKSGDPYDRDVVLRALVESVADYAERGRVPELIFATGDIAHSGQPAEYERAGQFFDDLLRAARLGKERLLVIPGNHDVDRDLGVGLARTLDSREQADAYFRADRPQPHLTLKLRAYREWHNRYFEGIRAAPDNSTCGPIVRVDLNGHRVGILPVNSALFCQDDDHDKLWVGRRCLEASLAELRKLKADLKIGLIHHPLEWLNAIEGSNIEAEIAAEIDILLRGHLHETKIDSVASAEGGFLRCAAGAAYQTRKWPNRAVYAEWLDDQLKIFPIRYEDSPRPIWTTDSSVFPRELNHERCFAIPRLARRPEAAKAPVATVSRPVQPARFRSNIPSRGSLPFVGRDDLLERLNVLLGNSGADAVVVLHGEPGVGKSELAREFARQQRDRYSGGTFWLDASTEAVGIHFASIAKTVLGLDFPPDLPLDEQGQRCFFALASAPSLLIYDNVVSFERLGSWLPMSGMPLHVLITTLLDPALVAWPCLEVARFSKSQSLELVERLTDAEFVARFGGAIAAHSDGLPVQIVPETATLAYERRRGRKPSGSLGLTPAAGRSFRNAYGRLDTPARFLLHSAALLNPQQILADELAGHLRKGADWSDGEVQAALDACLDVHLLGGSGELSMHQLFATFLREVELSGEEQKSIARVRASQSERFVELTKVVAANPADTPNAAKLISYPLTPDAWATVGQEFALEQVESVATALREIGRFSEARPWYERAVVEKEKGNGEGRVDHESLGNSLHQVGYCLWGTGQYEEAWVWFERAVGEAEKGDVHGRINHESLGRSLYQLGYSLSHMGEYEEALPWYERAVEEAAKGDIHGRISHESLGRGLHELGYCLSSIGKYEEAQSWHERAVEEAGKGDVHGRIDHESLGISLLEVGYCLSSMGQYAEARQWYERAVVEAGKGDVHGRINHETLGNSLRGVGSCLSSVGKYAEARPWYERSVTEAEKGDVHGRVDHESLGVSLRSVGSCLSSMGNYEEARPWYERAVTESEKGDVHGRIDHDGLGHCLHGVGSCLSSIGQYAEARLWFERAVAEKEKGDVNGVVDQESLGVSLRVGAECLRQLGMLDLAGEWEHRASECDAP